MTVIEQIAETERLCDTDEHFASLASIKELVRNDADDRCIVLMLAVLRCRVDHDKRHNAALSFRLRRDETVRCAYRSLVRPDSKAQARWLMQEHRESMQTERDGLRLMTDLAKLRAEDRRMR